MTQQLFKAAYGCDRMSLQDALLKIHDAAPNGDKRAWQLLIKASEDAALQGSDQSVSLLAGAIEDAARKRLNTMIQSVADTEDFLTHLQAESIVKSTAAGSVLSDLLAAAERTAMETCPLSKSVDESLDEKANESRIFATAREIQVTKAREGKAISLLDAVEQVKAKV